MPVHRRTHMYIKSVPTQDISLFSEAQVLSLAFIMVLKCDLFVNRGNQLTSSRVIMRNKQPL